MMDENEDPRAPYKVYEGDELKGTYATRAKARRPQQPVIRVDADSGVLWAKFG
jgi:hypothetical protein